MHDGYQIRRGLSAILAGGLLVCLVLSGLARPVLAHPGGGDQRYVAEQGHDQGECLDPAQPCRTIGYALAHAAKNDQIRVAAGRYQVAAVDIDAILNNLVQVHGGYRFADGFARRDDEINLTYLEGATADDRAALAEQGFIVIQDAKGWLSNLIFGRGAPTVESGQGFTACQDGFAGVHACEGIDLVSQIALSEFSSSPSEANDIWGFVDLNDEREYALIGFYNGTAVVDVTNPENPEEVGHIAGAGAIWRDIKVYQFFNAAQNRWNAYAYVTVDFPDPNDANPDHHGLQIIDLTGLPESVTLAGVYHGFTRAHNVYLGEIDYSTGVTVTGSTAYAYILGSDKSSGAYHILDLTDPISPVEVTPPQTSHYAHDATTLVITDSRTSACAAGHNPCELLVDYNESTVDLWDVTDKSDPFQISSTPYDGAAYTHSGWWSADKQFLFVQDESDEKDGFPPFSQAVSTTLRTLDISDLNNPFVSHAWHGPTIARDHNGFGVGNHYYMSNYQRGLTILDVTDPNDPQQTAFFDTYPAGDGVSYAGAWGVYPYLPSGNILISDIEGGLFVLREQTAPEYQLYIPVIVR